MKAKQLVLLLAAFVFVGCQTIYVTEEERAQLEELHQSGITWAGNPPQGYEPAVKMTPAIFWGLLPGAGQIFIADKMGDAKIKNHVGDQSRLAGKGVMMLAFSWIPWVYEFTMPIGIGGAIVDVNRANNLKLIQYCAEMETAKKPETTKMEIPVAVVEPTVQPNAATEQEQLLKDIDAAYREGFLSQEEYETKRASVLGGK